MSSSKVRISANIRLSYLRLKRTSFEWYIEEDLEDIVTLVQDGDVEAIKSLPQSLIREYIGINYAQIKLYVYVRKLRISEFIELLSNVYTICIYRGINARDKEGCSLMHWAAINNRYEIATFLIDNNVEGSRSSFLSFLSLLFSQ